MKAVVFGGSGFVGSHVADALADAGHEVTIFDRAESPWVRDDQQFVLGDIADPEAVVAATAGAEAVYNFAGLADLDTAREQPLETARANVIGNLNLLEAARDAGVGRFVFASTIYVFGDAGSFYRVSKQACELYVEEYSRAFGLDHTILRFGTLYGRRATDANSVHRYLQPGALRAADHRAGHRRGAARVHPRRGRGAAVRRGPRRGVREPAGRPYGQSPAALPRAARADRRDRPRRTHDRTDAAVAGGGRVVGPLRDLPVQLQAAARAQARLNHYTDIGQGLLDCMQELDEQDAEPG